MPEITVHKLTAGSYAIYANNDLLEAGLKTRREAEKAKSSWTRSILRDVVERAERAAGWDPHP